MAPAHQASASTDIDSIKGLAQSIAKPAYRRLLGAESALRRAVPILIIAFLVVVAVGAALQVHENRRQAVAAAATELALLASQIAERLNQSADDGRADLSRRLDNAFAALADRARGLSPVQELGELDEAALPGGKIGRLNHRSCRKARLRFDRRRTS